MEPITIIAFPCAPSGKEEELKKQFAKLVPATQAEPGCLSFIVHQHPKIKNHFAVYEQFVDQAAFEQHLQYEHTRKFVDWITENSCALSYDNWNPLLNPKSKSDYDNTKDIK